MPITIDALLFLAVRDLLIESGPCEARETAEVGGGFRKFEVLFLGGW